MIILDRPLGGSNASLYRWGLGSGRRCAGRRGCGRVDNRGDGPDVEVAVDGARFADSPPEGSGFELPVPRCALIANSAALVAPRDSAVSGGSLNGCLTTAIGGGPARDTDGR